VALLLFHAVLDREIQIRRTYGIAVYLLLAAALLLGALPIKGPVGAQFIPYGLVCIVLSWFFLIPFGRNEIEENWRSVATGVTGIVGVALAATGFIGGAISQTFLLGGEHFTPYGVLLLVLGLAYVWEFAQLRGTSDDLGYRTILGFGAAGLLFFLIALGRSALPPLLHHWGWLSARPQPYLVPSGLVLMAFGLCYAGLATGLASERRLNVLFRRELGAFFFSPIAYIVLLMYAALSAVFFLMFAADLSRAALRFEAIQEPVILRYLLTWWPVFINALLGVPILTMRLFSEEHRTGTLEVLLTSPVDEVFVVLSKFFAALLFWMMIWIPWGICLIAFRVEGGQPFEYRPILSFYLMQLITGAAFVSMGMFFSSLTRNQIIAAILTAAAMMLLTLVYFVKGSFSGATGGNWDTVLTHISYLDLWINSIRGEVTPKYFVFWISATIFWLFLTVKVLESRRWR
jgi:ABC-type transport system involved in multi-copper enzyme maturation permease subunit